MTGGLAAVTQVLPDAGGITGRILTADGQPIASPQVFIQRLDGPGGSGWADSDSSGNYHVGDLAAGSYAVCVGPLDVPADGFSYQQTCYDGKPNDPSLATPVSVALGQVLITALDASGATYYAYTDAAGNYQNQGEFPGSYSVCAVGTRMWIRAARPLRSTSAPDN